MNYCFQGLLGFKGWRLSVWELAWYSVFINLVEVVKIKSQNPPLCIFTQDFEEYLVNSGMPVLNYKFNIDDNSWEA